MLRVSAGCLVGPRVESGRLELVPGVGKQGSNSSWNRGIVPCQQPIDVEHPEADAFHVKRADRPHERFAFLNQRGNRRLLRLAPELGNDLLYQRLRALTMICVHDEGCAVSVPTGHADVNAPPSRAHRSRAASAGKPRSGAHRSRPSRDSGLDLGPPCKP
jgi:hypothetical protein